VKESRPSDTALAASVIRAVHQLIDRRPLILEDPISPRLLATETLDAIRKDPGRYQTPPAKGLRSHVILRSRYAEDLLQKGAAAGVTQFVNIGAGFDTFAFRQPPWANRLHVVEVDHPASQKAKQEYFSNRGFVAPENTRFVPVDLEKERLSAALSDTDVSRRSSAFFACLGVLAYLRRTTVRSIFEDIAAWPRGTTFVAAFAPRRADAESAVAERAAERGEPWISYFGQDEIEELFTTSGFSTFGFLSPAAAADSYYRDRTDLPAPNQTRLCWGIV